MNEIKFFGEESDYLEIEAVRSILLAYLNRANIRFGGKSAETHTTEIQTQQLQELLRALADFDPSRASQVSRILLPPPHG